MKPEAPHPEAPKNASAPHQQDGLINARLGGAIVAAFVGPAIAIIAQLVGPPDLPLTVALVTMIAIGLLLLASTRRA
jgi:hypothetical protein